MKDSIENGKEEASNKLNEDSHKHIIKEYLDKANKNGK